MELIEQIGAYAGFAAVVGLAVLSALFFSQARDVRRLREWAGRAPERAAQIEAEAQARAQAASRVVAQPQAKPGAAPAVPGAKHAAAEAKPAEATAAAEAKPATAQPAGAQPAGPSEAKPSTPGAKPATPAARPATAAAGATAAAAGAKPGANGAGEPGKAPPIPPRAQPAATTSILPPSARATARPPWYRRIAWPQPRYLALIAAGVIVVGGGAAFGISQLGGDDGGSQTAPVAQEAGGGSGSSGEGGRSPGAAVEPSTVTVSVLNGTTIGGLAADVADEVAAEGFLVGNVDNALDQAKAESVVLYAEGARREAQAVQRVLDISQLEPVDPDSQQRGGNASVIVVLGADRTP